MQVQATPIEIKDGHVSIEITVTGSYFPIDPVTSSGITDQVIRLDRSKISNTVNMKLGKTTLIGSVHMKARRKSKEGVPGLMNIPFVQYFFRKVLLHLTSQNLFLMLVTPRIFGRYKGG